MKKSTKTTLGFLTLLGGGLLILSKTKGLKTVGLVTGVTAGGILLSQMVKEEKKNVTKDCEETERAFEESELKPENLQQSSVSLLQTDEEEPESETPHMAKTILINLYRNSIFSDDVLEYNPDNYLDTLHIMQNLEKNRLLISIPLPIDSKIGFNTKDIRHHFQNLFEDFVNENKLEMKVFLNQIGVTVVKDSHYYYFDEILRSEGETFQDYLERIKRLIRLCSKGKQKEIEGLDLDEGEQLLRIDHYLNLEFPIFPDFSGRKGLDLILATKLIKQLTEPIYIKSNNHDNLFQLNKIAFHPSNDYGEIYYLKNKKIEIVEL